MAAIAVTTRSPMRKPPARACLSLSSPSHISQSGKENICVPTVASPLHQVPPTSASSLLPSSPRKPEVVTKLTCRISKVSMNSANSPLRGIGAESPASTPVSKGGTRVSRSLAELDATCSPVYNSPTPFGSPFQDYHCADLRRVSADYRQDVINNPQTGLAKEGEKCLRAEQQNYGSKPMCSTIFSWNPTCEDPVASTCGGFDPKFFSASPTSDRSSSTRYNGDSGPSSPSEHKTPDEFVFKSQPREVVSASQPVPMDMELLLCNVSPGPSHKSCTQDRVCSEINETESFPRKLRAARNLQAKLCAAVDLHAVTESLAVLPSRLAAEAAEERGTENTNKSRSMQTSCAGPCFVRLDKPGKWTLNASKLSMVSDSSSSQSSDMRKRTLGLPDGGLPHKRQVSSWRFSGKATSAPLFE